MARPLENIRFQAEHHPIVNSRQFSSLGDYCLHLMHLKSYEEAASLASGKDVLDLGCNNGYGTAVISQACDRAVGLDVSPKAIEDAKNQFTGLGIDFRIYDGDKIPFPDASFDLVTSFQVIEHIVDPIPYLSEIARVLRPSGLAIITTPNAAIRLDPGMKPWNEFHIREYLAQELADQLKPVFSNVEVQGLFATQAMYDIEYGRCQKALRDTRAWRSQPQPSLTQQARNAAKRLVKALLPEIVLGYIKAHRGSAAVPLNTKPPEAEALDQAALEKYSTKDFFYRTDNMDKALDLIAICQKN